MTKCILFNGPPGSGKDTAVQYVGDHIVAYNCAVKYQFVHEKFSRPLKESIASWIGQDAADRLERNKEEQVEELSGLSYRAAQIDLSERYLKPTYGNDCFGKWLADRLDQRKDRPRETVALISDSGFLTEARVLLDRYGAGNILLFHVHREGHTYAGDSRSYIELPKVHTIDLYNNEDVAVFQQTALYRTVKWLDQ